eukprot:TRINITY_DN1457_c0_g1_i4.p1 TRINITY_DN1457_c0_g1~~TRINITY_DN1457_c0_g1_i4.p1  ORF type:complete len:378 (-),score=112.02 TRINITY_DN1457_c0_g1_i4:52-1185(-)
MPVVIYCHGNCGSRIDALHSVRILLPMGISVVSFDCAGSGNSDGEYVSLGYFEKDDLEAVVDHLRETEEITRIALWGRSMGAATSLMYGATNPLIACMVLDSPFSSLKTLSNELVSKMESRIPKMMVGIGFRVVRKSVRNQAGFDINKLEPIKEAPKCWIPALFAHGEQDDFIDISHSEKLSGKYSGDHNMIRMEGDHNDPRPQFFYDSVSIFFSNNLIIENDFDDEENPMIEEEDETRLHYQEGRYMEENGYDQDLERAIQMSLLGFEKKEEKFDHLGQPDPQYMDEDEQLRMVLELSRIEAEQANIPTDNDAVFDPEIDLELDRDLIDAAFGDILDGSPIDLESDESIEELDKHKSNKKNKHKSKKNKKDKKKKK